MNREEQVCKAEKIRNKYVETQETEADLLRKMDGKVKKPARALAYTVGVIGTIAMGAGMSLVMTDVGACDAFEIQTVHGLGYKAVIK